MLKQLFILFLFFLQTLWMILYLSKSLNKQKAFKMSESGDQLVSFFLYSLFIYPVTNYIVSPQRKYPKWKAALYAVLFLAGVAALHMVSLIFNCVNIYNLNGIIFYRCMKIRKQVLTIISYFELIDILQFLI